MNHRMVIYGFLSALATAILFQAGCSKTDNHSSDAQTTSAVSSPVKNELKPLYWAVAQPSYPPFSSRDEQGLMIGFDIDLLNAIAEQENIEISFRPHDVMGLLETLDENTSDIVLSGINITPERRHRYGFTDVYLQSDWVALLDAPSKVSPKLTHFSQVRGKTVVIAGSAAKQRLRQSLGNSVDVQEYDSVYRAVAALHKNTNLAVYDVEQVLKGYAREREGLYMLKDPSASKAYFAFVVRKDNPLLIKILNNGLAKVKHNGTYQKLLEKWKLDDTKKMNMK